MGQPSDHASRPPLRPVATARHAPRDRRRHAADRGAAGGGVIISSSRPSEHLRARAGIQQPPASAVRQLVDAYLNNNGLWLWIPAFAGTTARLGLAPALNS